MGEEWQRPPWVGRQGLPSEDLREEETQDPPALIPVAGKAASRAPPWGSASTVSGGVSSSGAGIVAQPVKPLLEMPALTSEHPCQSWWLHVDPAPCERTWEGRSAGVLGPAPTSKTWIQLQVSCSWLQLSPVLAIRRMRMSPHPLKKIEKP